MGALKHILVSKWAVDVTSLRTPGLERRNWFLVFITYIVEGNSCNNGNVIETDIQYYGKVSIV